MSNSLNIAEYTLAQLSAAATACNVIGASAGNRPYWDTPMTVRVTDHKDNVALEEDDPNQMALFTSRAHGLPWKKDTALIHKVILADADPVTNATPTDVSVLFPNFDYTTF